MKAHRHEEKVPVVQFERTARKKALTSRSVCRFHETIYDYYRKHARKFPWRRTRNPYHILVSEIMLQQTQTERVIEKYREFINAFPDFVTLSHARLQKILSIWQGLGYNRRALALKKITQMVVTKYGGKLPHCLEELMTFPGIGRATASAISVFAFNRPAVFIETNIRRVFLHFFFHNKSNVKDAEILPMVEKNLDASSPRKWYYALMDYGAMLGKGSQNPNRRSAHYHRQSSFKGSNRQIRGMILRAVLKKPLIGEYELAKRLGVSRTRIKANLMQLQKEGFMQRKGKQFTLA